MNGHIVHRILKSSFFQNARSWGFTTEEAGMKPTNAGSSPEGLPSLPHSSAGILGRAAPGAPAPPLRDRVRTAAPPLRIPPGPGGERRTEPPVPAPAASPVLPHHRHARPLLPPRSPAPARPPAHRRTARPLTQLGTLLLSLTFLHWLSGSSMATGAARRGGRGGGRAFPTDARRGWSRCRRRAAPSAHSRDSAKGGAGRSRGPAAGGRDGGREGGRRLRGHGATAAPPRACAAPWRAQGTVAATSVSAGTFCGCSYPCPYPCPCRCPCPCPCHPPRPGPAPTNTALFIQVDVVLTYDERR